MIKCSVLPESCSVPSGIYVQFVLETSFRFTGICIVDIPAAKTPIANTLIPNNLGVVIQARELLDFEKML